MDNNITPPYGSVNRLRYVFELFSTHNFTQITSSFLKSRGFSGSDAFQTIAALKFLGIIDSEGNKTEKMTNLQLKGDQHTAAVLDIVKSAYSKLFETIAEPNKLSKDDLYNDFVSVYKLSGRLASTAVPNFLWLCQEAGLEVEEAPVIKERKPRSRSLDKPKGESKDLAKVVSTEPVSKIISGDIMGEAGSGMIKFELPLRANARAIIFTPADLNSGDIKKIQGYIDFLNTLVKDLVNSKVDDSNNSGEVA